MAPTVFAGNSSFFEASGWHRFFLNQKLQIASPDTALAGLCGLLPDSLTGRPFAQLFAPACQNKLTAALSQLSGPAARPVHSLALELHCNRQHLPVEIMLYPAPQPGPAYLGFIRAIPAPVITFLEENITSQLSLKNRQLKAVAELGHHIAAILDLDTLLNYVVDSLSQEFDYTYTSIFIVDANETTAHLKAASGTAIDELPPEHLSLKINNQTIIGRVATTAKPILTGQAAQYQGQIPAHWAINTCSELAVPVISSGQVLGILDVQSQNPNQYNDDDLLLLQTIADQLAAAIENARLFEERDRRMAELAVFSQIGVSIVGGQNLTRVLSDILQRVNALFQVEAVSLMLLKEDGLHFAVATGAGADEVKSFVLKPGQGIAWSVVESRQTIRVDDVAADPRHFSDIDSAIEFKTRSLLAVPVQIQDRIIGVIEVMNRLDGRPFTRENEVTMEFIASAIAVTIENARLFQETQDQLKALTTLTQASEAMTKAQNLDLLLDSVLTFSLSIINAKTGAIILLNHAANKLSIEAARGLSDEEIASFNRRNFSQYMGIFSELLRTRQTLEVTNSASDPRIFTNNGAAWTFPPAFTLLPLFSQDNFIGSILLYALPDDDARALLRTVADMAAVAIDKARLFEETNRWLAEVLTLYTLADQLTKVLDMGLEDVIQSSVSVLEHALDCDRCCILLKEPATEGDALVLSACSGWYEADPDHLDMQYVAAVAETLFDAPHTLYIEDITNPDAITPLGLPDPALFWQNRPPGNRRQIQFRSVMIVPLIVKDELLGVLTIDDRRPQAFGHSEERLLTIASAQIATAIENIRLYDNLERRAAELEVALKEMQEAHRIKSEFVQNVSHELRTPLTFVRAYVELILEGSLGPVPEEVYQKLQIVSQKTTAITRLVEDVISLQRVEAGNLRFERISPYELITRATYAAKASAAEYNIDIIARGSPNLPGVNVDVDRIGQVFDNLVANAIKFSPAGSKIYIGARQEGDWINFYVQDFGIGIPADKLDKVFERFYQVDGSTTRRYGGTGLGLAIVKQIVEAHGGQVTVESTINKSTTFSFKLPVFQENVTIKPV